MHLLWNTIKKIRDTDAYNFKLDKKKCRVDTEVFCKILQIYPRLHNQEFVKPPSEDELIPFIQELGYSGKCEILSAIHTDQMHQPWRTFAAIINRCISGKTIVRDDPLLGTLKFVSKTEDYQKYEADTPKKARKFKKIASPSRKLSPVLKAKPAKKPKKAKKSVKKSTTVPTAGVIIRDTPGVGSKPKVPDDSKDKTTGTDEGTDDESNDDDSDDDNDGANDDSKNDDDGDSDVDDSERTDSNSDEEVNPNLNLKDDDEEETQDDDYIRTPDYYVPTDEEFHEENREFDEEEYDDLYKDVNITPKDTKLKNEGKGDAEMTDAGLEDVSQEKTYEQVVDDAHVTLTSTQKTNGSKQSSSVSTDFANKFLNLDNVPPTDSEVASMMNVKAH
ncbi:hypothetical protein Tco_0621899 [Tanacetum coccineum]